MQGLFPCLRALWRRLVVSIQSPAGPVAQRQTGAPPQVRLLSTAAPATAERSSRRSSGLHRVAATFTSPTRRSSGQPPASRRLPLSSTLGSAMNAKSVRMPSVVVAPPCHPDPVARGSVRTTPNRSALTGSPAEHRCPCHSRAFVPQGPAVFAGRCLRSPAQPGAQADSHRQAGVCRLALR